MAIRIIQSDRPLEDPAVAEVRDKLRAANLSSPGQEKTDIPAVVRGIIADVRARGDQAVIDLTASIEKVALTPASIRVEADKIEAARAAADADFMALMRRAIENIRRYQRHILIQPPPPLKRGGRELGVRYTPIDRVGVYVPGAKAFYPSTVLMTVVPAQVAGVREIAIVSPPTSGSDVHPMVLALAGELGIGEVYRVSGTAGLAAMAIGTRSIRPVSKIVGPGNAFIAEAKRQLFGLVGIDSIAGPSEVLIVADETARPAWVAADMLAQAEHNPGSAVLVTSSEKLAKAVAAEIERQLTTPEMASRAAATRACIEAYSAIIVVPNLENASAVANDFASEHLQIITADDGAVLKRIRNAGAVFMGCFSPVPLGDYYAGPSHVLPTGGTAKFFGPLSCNDFLKASSLVRYDAASLADDAADVADFATREGLIGHAQAVRIREN
jgi:histidinol dehydrogenase